MKEEQVRKIILKYQKLLADIGFDFLKVDKDMVNGWVKWSELPIDTEEIDEASRQLGSEELQTLYKEMCMEIYEAVNPHIKSKLYKVLK